MAISWEQILATIINFLILLIILKFTFWNKIKIGIEARQNAIKEKVAKTSENFRESEELKAKNREILKNANMEAQKLAELKKQQSMKRFDEIVNEAKAKAELIKERAEADIERESAKMKHSLKKEAVEIAVDLSKKAVGNMIDEDKHRKLIDNFIKEVGV